MKRFKVLNFGYEAKPRKDCLCCGKLLGPSLGKHKEFCGRECRFSFNNNSAHMFRFLVKTKLNETLENFTDWMSKVSGEDSITLKLARS